jgi:CubicO group peptidase (beta-lactamase class C family)
MVNKPLPTLLLLGLVLSPTSAAAQGHVEKIDALLSRYHEYELFNGAVLVAESRRIIYEKGFGYADMEWQVANDASTKFRVGSVTKQFTASLILQLVEEGKIDLQATIREYLPDYPPEQGDRVTIHQLLTHTSGIPSYTGLPDFDQVMRDPYDPEAFLEVFSGLELEFEPGSEWRYSNSGYFLLGVIIERVTGRPYDEVLHDRILAPLGLANTGYDHYEEIIEREAEGYVQTVTGYEDAPYLDTSIPFSAGMMYSTVEDLFAWDQSLYGNGPFREARTKELMFTPYAEVPFDEDEDVHYGYGWLLRRVPVGEDTIDVIEHGGGIFGFTTGFRRIPEDGNTIIVMDNTGSAAVPDMVNGITSVLYDRPANAPRRPIARVLAPIIEDDGVEAAIARYRSLKDEKPTAYDFSESQLNTLGYYYLGRDEIDTAIRIFKLNVEAYPDSFNTYDSLGEAYMAAGEREPAIENYRKSLELNPENENAKRILERLGVEVEDATGRVPG